MKKLTAPGRLHAGPFNDLFDGGIIRGSITLIVGGAGAGKTTMALQIARAIIDFNLPREPGARVMYASFDQSEPGLREKAQCLGISPERTVTFNGRPPCCGGYVLDGNSRLLQFRHGQKGGRTMKVYVAGSSAEMEDVERFMNALRAEKIEITCDWPAAIRAAGDANPADDAIREKAANEDLDGVESADIFWLMVPAQKGSAGAWVELGYAIARDMRIVISGEFRKCIFTSLADEMFDTHEAALAHIIEQDKEAA